MPQAKAKSKPVIVARQFQPQIVEMRLGGLVVVVDTGTTLQVMVARGTFVRRESALAYAAILEKKLQVNGLGGDE